MRDGGPGNGMGNVVQHPYLIDYFARRTPQALLIPGMKDPHALRFSWLLLLCLEPANASLAVEPTPGVAAVAAYAGPGRSERLLHPASYEPATTPCRSYPGHSTEGT